MKRRLTRNILVTLALLTGLAISVMYWILGSTSGAQWVLQNFAGESIRYSQALGSL